jgi:hypothetical protein
MDFEKIIKEHDAFVFGLDNVIYPEKDFLLQVYYLFGQFIEYSEQLDAATILNYMQQVYQTDGHEGIFEKTASKFGIPEKYKENFELLQTNIRLPLKLLLFEPCMRFLKHIVMEGKPVFLLVEGLPEAQLNKIRQVDWQGLEQYLTVYFSDEIDTGKGDKGLGYIADQHQFIGKNILMVGKKDDAVFEIPGFNLKFLNNGELFYP